MNGLIAPGDFEHALAHLHFTTPEQVPQRPDPPIVPPSTSPKSLRAARDQLPPPTTTEIRPISISLPPEILLCVGHALFDPWRPSIPSWTILSASDSHDHLADVERRLCLRTLWSLSSTCLVARALMAPMLWHSVRLTHPAQLGPLRTLMKWYQRSSFSLSSAPSSSGDLDKPKLVLSERASLPFPLPLVRRLDICIPDVYPSFDNEALCDLLRSGMASGLKELCWDAEKTPTASALAILASYSDSSRSRAAVEQQGDRSFDRIETASRAVKGALADKMESEIGRSPWAEGVGSEMNESVVRWARESERGAGFPGMGRALGEGDASRRREHQDGSSSSAEEGGFHSDSDSDDDEETDSTDTGLVSLSVNCKMFWPGHPHLARLTKLRHLQLTKYDTFLMPPQLPALLTSLRRPLLSLSMSTSKVSLLHTLPLLKRGAFSKLRYLDVYPVTPEEPLPGSLQSAAPNLVHLRLILDVNGGFSNFDDLWRKLAAGQSSRGTTTTTTTMTGGMPHLETLDVDPYPSQHTAPAFEDFVRRSAPRLRRINGREAACLLETQGALLNPIDPDHITSALAY